MNTQEQINRIQMILGHPSMNTCFDCGFIYLPMNGITKHLCPKCQTKEIEEVKAGLLTVEIEEVSTDNNDLLLFDMKESDRLERIQKSKIGGKKAAIAKRTTK